MNDITTIVLDRPRHHDLIEEIRAAGARIKLIQDGDVTASISAAIRGTNDHLAIGIGGTRQAVLTAAALRCLGGELQAQLWPTTRAEIDEAREQGIDDVDRVFTIDELAPREVIVAATGVSNGDLLRGVRFLADSAADALARHVHPLQLGALRRRDPLLRPRTPRRSAAPGLLASAQLGWGHADEGRSRRGAPRGRGSRARDGHRRPRAALRRRDRGPKIKVIHSLTSMGCPAGPMIQEDIVTSRPGVEVEIELTRTAVDAGADVAREFTSSASATRCPETLA